MKTTKTLTKKAQKHKEAQKKRNAAFMALSPEAKRAKIAKDVLKMLSEKKLKPTPGTYFSALELGRVPGKQEQLQDVLKEVESCKVCALGSLLVATVANADRFKCGKFQIGNPFNDNVFDDNVSGGHIGDFEEYLTDFFSQEQMAAIEAAFERRTITRSNVPGMSSYPCVYDSAAKFAANEASPTRRLQKIMRNIIKNNGTFVF